jgi:4'-phosphopantetheinyl transferase
VTEPGPREIDIWYQRLDEQPSEPQLQAWLALLSDDEKARYHRFYFDKDRLQYVAAHALVRLALSQYFPVNPADWQFEANPWGKPSVFNPEGKGKIGFNLSHTQGLVACGIARTEALGLDVEWIDRHNTLGDIARHSFSPDEIAHFESAHPERQRDVFFRLWTLKEAYIKARGQGLSIPLTSFSFRFAADDTTAIRFTAGHTGSISEWSFFEYQPSPSHRMAVAVHHRESGAWKVELRAAERLMAAKCDRELKAE